MHLNNEPVYNKNIYEKMWNEVWKSFKVRVRFKV